MSVGRRKEEEVGKRGEEIGDGRWSRREGRFKELRRRRRRRS